MKEKKESLEQWHGCLPLSPNRREGTSLRQDWTQGWKTSRYMLGWELLGYFAWWLKLVEFLKHLLILHCRQFGQLYHSKAAVVLRAALPFPASVCSIFIGSKQWYGCQYFGFSKYTQIYTPAWNYTWGCTNTVRESALKIDWGRKIHWRTGEWKPVTVLCLAFQSGTLLTGISLWIAAESISNSCAFLSCFENNDNGISDVLNPKQNNLIVLKM